MGDKKMIKFSGKAKKGKKNKNNKEDVVLNSSLNGLLMDALMSGDIGKLIDEPKTINNVCLINDVELYKKVEDFGCDNVVHDNTALHNACIYSPDIVDYIIKNTHPKVLNKALEYKNKQGNTPLHLYVASSISDSKFDLIDKAIEVGAGIDLKNDKGDTPLMIACIKGKVGVAKALIKAGANVNSISTDGSNALMFSIMGGNDELIELTLTESNIKGIRKDNANPLYLEIYGDFNNDIKTLKMLLDKGANINELSGEKNGILLMMMSQKYSEEQLIEVIKMGKFDFELDERRTKNENHYTLLIHAIALGFFDLYKLIFDKYSEKQHAMAWTMAMDRYRYEFVKYANSKGMNSVKVNELLKDM